MKKPCGPFRKTNYRFRTKINIGGSRHILQAKKIQIKTSHTWLDDR